MFEFFDEGCDLHFALELLGRKILGDVSAAEGYVECALLAVLDPGLFCGKETRGNFRVIFAVAYSRYFLHLILIL